MWAKVKKYAGWIIGGALAALAAFIGILFAVREERKKVTKMKADVVVARAKKDLQDLRNKRIELDVKDKLTREKAQQITDEIVRKDRELEKIQAKVKELDNDEVAQEFNDMYRSG